MASQYLSLPESGGGGGAVDSVNGQTGVVVLTADDVGAASQALDNLSNTAVNDDILPDTDNTRVLGNASFRWSVVDTETATVINLTSHTPTINVEASVPNGDFNISANVNLLPNGSSNNLKFYNNAGNQYVALSVDTSLAATTTYQLPSAFGSAGDVLTDLGGDGVLSWEPSGGGSSGVFTVLNIVIQAAQQTISFDDVADSGSFDVDYLASGSPATINWDDDESTIQAALAAIPGLSGISVVGTVADSIAIQFLTPVFTAPISALTISNNTLLNGASPVTPSVSVDNEPAQEFTLTDADFGKFVIFTGFGDNQINTPDPNTNAGGSFYFRNDMAGYDVNIQNIIESPLGALNSGLFISAGISGVFKAVATHAP